MQLMSLGKEDKVGRVCGLLVKTQREGAVCKRRRRASGETSPPHNFLLDCKGVSVRCRGYGSPGSQWRE